MTHTVIRQFSCVFRVPWPRRNRRPVVFWSFSEDIQKRMCQGDDTLNTVFFWRGKLRFARSPGTHEKTFHVERKYMSILSDQKSNKRTQLKPLCWSSLMASTIRLAACSAFHRLSRSESNSWMSDCRVNYIWNQRHTKSFVWWEKVKRKQRNRQEFLPEADHGFKPNRKLFKLAKSNLILFNSYQIRVFFSSDNY